MAPLRAAEDRSAGRPLGVRGGEGVDESAGQARGNDAVAGRHGPDADDEFLGACVFEEEAGRAGSQGLVGVLVEVEGGQDQDPRATAGLGDAAGGLDAVDAGHPDVHQDDVGAQSRGQANGLLPLGGFADD
ncbi:hypothetical protein J2S47_000005 [Streptomyces griseoviridis]|uniref:Uncharacterized protein n=1 Tax=Streptomyces griseoviridis TaxID=45398 RepID=A0ABT9L716_STRGD|nr:hypothetical protein [Streptomyces griseoviridis]